jgi:hypothetical protein
MDPDQLADYLNRMVGIRPVVNAAIWLVSLLILGAPEATIWLLAGMAFFCSRLRFGVAVSEGVSVALMIAAILKLAPWPKASALFGPLLS